ncbi:type II secretion system major pseudopilin GspG [Variovorax sp. AFSI2.2]|uniref:type II secretion system major pseudopilin GspG n=1 Tax=Variovorax sp. AFSI2.2 TaxID=3384160 RepID=UPI003EC06C08
MPRRQRSSGFTLIEVLVVITILGILAALVIPKIMDRPNDARVAATRQQIADIVQALNLYKLDAGGYPTSSQGLTSLVQKPSSGKIPPNWRPYMDKLPKDAWGNDMQYRAPGLHGEIDVFSLGGDGETGGEGYNADIGNWMQ